VGGGGGGEGGLVGGTGCLQLRRWRGEREEEKREGGREMPWVSFEVAAEGGAKKQEQGEEENKVGDAEEGAKEGEQGEEEKKMQERIERRGRRRAKKARAVARHVLECGLTADLFVELCLYFKLQWVKSNGQSRVVERVIEI